MLISYGTPLQYIIYDGSQTFPGGGNAVFPSGTTTFPAIPDPSGSTGLAIIANWVGFNSMGLQGSISSNAVAFVNQTSAQTYLTAQIAANPGNALIVGFPAYTATPLTFSQPTRPLNSSFQISSGQNAFVSYAVDISVSSPLLAGSQGTVTLQYADDSAFTTNVKTVPSGTNSTSGLLNITNVGTVQLVGIIPAGKYAKLVTATVTGSPTFTSRQGQEVLL